MTWFRPVALAALAVLAMAALAPASQAGVVRGSVLETNSGRPVKGARAYTFLPGQANTVYSQALGDSAGVFWLARVPPGVITVRVQAPGHDQWAGTVSMGGETDTEKVVVRLNRVAMPGLASGVITAEGGRKPGRLAHIGVKGTSLDAQADSSGQFFLYQIPVGPQTLQFVALGYDPVIVPIVAEEGRNTVVHADLGHSLVAGGPAPKPMPVAALADTVVNLRFDVLDTTTVRRPGGAPMRHVTIEIRSGERVVRTLMDWDTAPGAYTVAWDGRDDTGKAVPAGSYRFRRTVSPDPPVEGDIVKK